MRKVVRFARYLADGFGCAQLIAVTASDWAQPIVLAGDRDVCRWMANDLHTTGAGAAPDTSPGALRRTAVFCRLHAGAASTPVLRVLRSWLVHAPVALVLLSSDQAAGGPAAVQETLTAHGLNVPFAGWTSPESTDRPELMAIVDRHSPPAACGGTGLRVRAFMPTFNEADIVSHSIEYLVAQGAEVYVLDNWSTDGTLERARAFLGAGVAGIERFPASGPTGVYDWRAILTRIETLAERCDADWIVLHDADERRHSPWPGTSLRAALAHVDRCGYSSIDHVVMNFWPADDRFDPSRDVEEQLLHWRFSDHPGHFHERRAWKNPGCRVSLAPTAGHDVRFPGRLVYPFKFLLKHYPIRSQAHGEQKIFRDRRPRWSAGERALGWHQQYDGVRPGMSLRGDASELARFDPATFFERYLIERLSGVGIYEAPPPWATGPREPFGAGGHESAA